MKNSIMIPEDEIKELEQKVEKLEKENKKLISLLTWVLKVRNILFPKGSLIIEENKKEVELLTKMFNKIEKENVKNVKMW